MTAHKFPLSQKYRDFIRSTQGVTAEFLEGTTASGKTTVGAGVKFMYMVSASPKRLHIIAAKTTGIAEKNIIQQENGILDLHRNAVYCGNGDRNNKLPHIKFEGKLIYVLGYDNKDKWENVLGSQFSCVYIDEINTADIDFVREISTRNDYLLATLNPDDPSLPVYREFVNRSRPCARYAAQEQAWRKRLNSLVKENSDVLRMDYRRLKVYDAPVPPAGKTAAVPPTPKPKAAKAKAYTEGVSSGRAVEVTPPATKDNVGYSLEKIGGKSLTSEDSGGIIKAEYKRFHTGEEVNKYFGGSGGILEKQKSCEKRWVKSLTQNETGAVVSYCADGYYDINTYFRKTNGAEFIDPDSMESFARDLDSAISKFELKDSITVYRGVDNNALVGLDLNSIVGSIYEDNGYMSASPIHADIVDRRDALFEIQVPAGKGVGAYVNSLSGFKDDEYEFLLKRGTRCEILSVDLSSEKPIIKMRVIK